MEYPIKRHCTSFIQPCITISWENFPLFLEKLKNRGLVWLAWVLLLRFTVKCSKMAQGKKNVKVRKSVGALPYNNAAWDMTIFLHYEHLFVTKNSYKCSPCTNSTLHGLSVLFSRASWHKSANWCASALWSKDLARDLAQQRLRVKCFYLLLVYWFKRQRDRTLESTKSHYCNMFLRSGYTCSLWYRTILKWASKVNPGLLRFCLRGSVIGPVYPRHLLVFNWALW